MELFIQSINKEIQSSGTCVRGTREEVMMGLPHRWHGRVNAGGEPSMSDKFGWAAATAR